MHCNSCQTLTTSKWYSGPKCAPCYQRQRKLNDPEKVREIARKTTKKRRHERGQERLDWELRWRRSNKSALKNSYLKHKYGITLQQYQEISKSQDDVCAICRQKNTRSVDSGLVVDHCHETEIVRGLLCHNCNVALGSFRDNESFLQSAIDYLRKSRT